MTGKARFINAFFTEFLKWSLNNSSSSFFFLFFFSSIIIHNITDNFLLLFNETTYYYNTYTCEILSFNFISHLYSNSRSLFNFYIQAELYLAHAEVDILQRIYFLYLQLISFT